MKPNSIELDACGESLRIAGAPESVVRYLLGLQAAVDELSTLRIDPPRPHVGVDYGHRELDTSVSVLRHPDGTLEVLR